MIKMPVPGLVVKFGELIDIDGPLRKHDGVAIAPARVQLHGTHFRFETPLAEYLRAHAQPAEVICLMLEGSDAVWVRGRLHRLFMIEVPPEEDRTEKSGLAAGFIAAIAQPDGTYLAVPFECCDCYLKTSLMFSTEDGPPDALRQRIADAFWGLLLEEPNDLAEYQDMLFHLGGGFWLAFGVDHGVPFVEEQDDPPYRK